MSGENKKTGTDNKIMSFQIAEEELQDPKLDHYVRESLIREADELEEELNQKPELADVKAPAGMYQSIVSELKARGVWEEDGETLKALYAQLPEEDQKALALGRELVQKNEAKEKKRRSRRKVFRIAGVSAACMALVFGISMTSDANRRLAQRMWDGLMASFGFMVQTDYLGDEEAVRSKSKEEIAAIEEISGRLGSPSLDFSYLPKGMRYEGYEITNDVTAALFYSYRDTLFYVTIISMGDEGSHYYKYDSEAIFQKNAENHDGIKAEIWEVNSDSEEKTYVAELEYNDWRYVLNGMLPLEELEKIIKNLMIL